MKSCDEADEWPYEPIHLVAVWDDDSNPEVGRLYAADGSLLSIVRAREALPFGFTGER